MSVVEKKTTLLIMAAGIGSRYGGGIKQLATVDNSDHIIMDYSVHDAIKAGFNQIVFIIRKDIEKDFKEIIGNRIQEICDKNNVEMRYAFQDIRNIPFEFPEGRTKPWGTGHAVLAAKEWIDSPFAVINADDYYGKKAFKELHDWLVEDHADTAIAMAGFILKNTLSDFGGVTRGLCIVKEGHTHISNVVETKNIIKTADGPEADGQKLDPESYVSMNMWGFPAKAGEIPPFMDSLEKHFLTFAEQAMPEDPMTGEYLLPSLVGLLLREEGYTVKVLPTQDKWFGVTYQEDRPFVMESFAKLIEEGVYEKDLYSDL